MNEKELQGSKILIVDDTPANIDVLFQTLEPEGYKLFVASSGQGALDLVTQALPDLILLDIMLPGIDGYETCRRLKSDPDTAVIPIIFITAKTETEDIVKGFSVGGIDYIAKPFRHEEVCARIRTHLKLQHLVHQLETQNNNLRELNELKNKFLGMASHDLRNPLSTIRGFSKILAERGDKLSEASRAQFTQTIHKVSNNMLELISDLLDVSVIESGNLSLHTKQDSINRLAEEYIKTYEIFAKDKSITLVHDLKLVPEFDFDANRLGQVIDNLLSNAIKFSDPETQIEISLNQVNGHAVFSVQDQGPGLSEEDQEKLFIHFQKLSAQPTGGESSSGLGLAIAKKMVEAHGGTLKVESRLGEGSTFGFRIPLDKKKPG